MSYSIEIPDELAERLDAFPLVTWSRKIEQAINAALDREGFPGAAEIDTKPLFVNIWYKNGQIRGHVGPISGMTKAAAASKSWRKASPGHYAKVSTNKLGPSLMYSVDMGQLLQS
jgi:hypothetical protein